MLASGGCGTARSWKRAMSAVTDIRSPRTHGGDDPSQSEPQFRYAAVLVLMLTEVVFVIAAPSGPWGRGVSILIAGTALVVAVGTSRERESVRRRRALVIGVGLIVIVLLVGFRVL